MEQQTVAPAQASLEAMRAHRAQREAQRRALPQPIIVFEDYEALLEAHGYMSPAERAAERADKIAGDSGEYGDADD